jgi:hypothetical protein
MATIHIDNNLHREVKIEAAQQGIKITPFVEAILRRAVSPPKGAKVFRYPTASELQEAREVGIIASPAKAWLPPLPDQNPPPTKPDTQNPFDEN